ncbi:hypothetical protein FSP39_000549 [Pinctada imbricata]|uniref:Arsenite methyltransferase n=1 Tax=Pinctada imbricata TaxID=66713 RepID=A0AA88XXH3_PINIB|nr:hypothetical protein FSP39_000549 [Pinctada imbricata]
MATVESNQIHDSVKDYYGKRVKTADDLQTQACVAVGKKVSKPVREAIAAVHDEVASKYYGCGLVIPEKVNGMKILDLGSGSGRDCFAMSKLVGQNGHVTGVDMTDEQIAVARKYIDYHTQKFGYDKPNIDFVQGYIEKLTEAGIKENFYDIIISNCVINLSPDKKAVLRDAYKVLKVGGELYFSDVYTDSHLTEEIRKHEVLWGECISGALHWKELFDLADELGFSRPYLVTASPIDIEREDFQKILGEAKFVSATYRLFKLPAKKESSTQVIYNGEIEGYEDQLVFEHDNVFKKSDVVCVGGDIVTALKASRFCDEFDYQPVTKKQCGTDNSCGDSNKSGDPFLYLEEKKKKGEKMQSSCVGSKACC